LIRPEHLRMARAGLGWTLRDLAHRAEVNPNTISRYETGKDIMAGTLRKIEATLRAAGVGFIDEPGTTGVTIPLQ
jgi:transcriptional regulator with XRE-family HTH domain